jgi:hypothetical protein
LRPSSTTPSRPLRPLEVGSTGGTPFLGALVTELITLGIPPDVAQSVFAFTLRGLGLLFGGGVGELIA